MKHDWSTEELAAQWSLLPTDREFLGNKTGASRLGSSRRRAAFPRQVSLRTSAVKSGSSPPNGLTMSGGGVLSNATALRFVRGWDFGRVRLKMERRWPSGWKKQVLARDRQMARLKAAVHERCRFLRIEPPTPDRIERLIRSAIAEFERKFCEALLSRLSPEAQTKLNAVLRRRSGRS